MGEVDFVEAGSVHSSVSGAFLVRAVDLFGYGKTPAWSGEAAQTLEDQAKLVEARDS
jgi:hypothetical protein